MRPMIRAVAAAAFAAALIASAQAAPFTSHFDDLRTFMQTKHDAILPNSSENEQIERAALEQGLAALNAKSTSLAGDVRIFGRVAAAIDIPLLRPDNDQPLSDAIFALQLDARPLRDALAARIDTLVAPKLLAAAQKNLVDIDAAMNTSVSAGSPYTVGANALLFALKTIAATNAKITKGTAPRGSPARPGLGYFAGLVDGALYRPTFGSGRVKTDSGLVSEVTLTGYFPSLAQGGIEIQWSTGTFTGPGIYPLDGTSGAFIVLNQNGNVFYTDGSGGQVTVTAYDPVKKQIAGTFEASLVTDSDVLGTTAHTIQKGSFDVRRYATFGK